MKKVYISGRITGNPDAENEFDDAERLLSGKGYTPVNPMKNGLPAHSAYETHMRADIILLCSCDLIYQIPGWRKSNGAIIESIIASLLKIGIWGDHDI
jgi:hypothetical protein